MTTYYQQNKEAVKMKQREYYQKNKEHIKQVQAQYRYGNEELKANKKAFYEANRDDINAKRQLKTKEKCVCVCGCEVVKVQLKRHMATRKHNELLEHDKKMNETIVSMMGEEQTTEAE